MIRTLYCLQCMYSRWSQNRLFFFYQVLLCTFVIALGRLSCHVSTNPVPFAVGVVPQFMDSIYANGSDNALGWVDGYCGWTNIS